VAQGEATVIPPASPVQQYLPHWLGEMKDGETWFAVTQAIQMAEHTRETQVLALAKGNDKLKSTWQLGPKKPRDKECDNQQEAFQKAVGAVL
ncbi:hypothetical protein O0466_005015, partial [Salmonella enterica]|nr:hypothetical protein [Salmonella enterica]EKF8527894.1 hypothetical protein [Salmonella enterica]EKM8518557.1 hypothetical protein [Salmonella enterica]ELB6048875.1 hypothetical protein [Salmonella enterica]ELV7805711.1 hypothetical protein [Salmonella enterica]